MYFSKNEESIIKTFYVQLGEYISNTMNLVWNKNDSIVAKFDTCFDDDNELEMDDKNYEEYTTFVFKVIKILGNPPVEVSEDNLCPINYHNFPKEILVQGKKIN